MHLDGAGRADWTERGSVETDSRRRGNLVADTGTWPLIGPADPAPVELVRMEGEAPLLLVADHAGRAFPAALNRLGLREAELGLHITYDIGVRSLTHRLAHHLDAPAVLGTYSRLLIDPNRGLDRADSIPAVSDSIPIPGNRALTAPERHQRAESFFWPFQDAVAAALDRQVSRHGRPLFVAVHSFTPVFKGERRPWHVGVLWGDDVASAMPVLAALSAIDGLCVGDNEPYDGHDDWGGTVHRHAVARDLPHWAIEVRQDLIADEAGVERWADLLAGVIAPLLARR